MNLLRGHLGSLNASIGSVGSSLTAFLPALGVLGAGASLVGMVAMTRSLADAAVEGDALSKKLGMSMKDLSGFRQAAKETHVATETMVGGLEKFNRTLGMVVAGKAKDAAAALHHLGLSNKQIGDYAKNPAALLPKLADAFAKTQSPATRAAVATMLFGKAGQELLPILMLGGDALDEMGKKAAKLNYFATPEQKKALIELSHGFEDLDTAASGFKKEIGSALAPILVPIVKSMTDWILANRDWIATGIVNKVQALFEALKPLGPVIQGVMDGTTSWGQGLMKVSDGHYGLMAVIGAFTLALGSPLIGAVTGVIGIMAALRNVLLGLAVVAWANPIVAGVALAAAAAYVLIYHWDKVKDAMAWVWQQMKEGAEATRSYWEPLRDFFVTLWDSIAGAFTRGWDKIKAIIDSLKNAVNWARSSGLGHMLGLDEDSMADTSKGRAGGNSARGHPAGALAPFNPWQYPGVYQPGSAVSQPPVPQNGKVDVKIDFANTPPGTQIRTDADGIAERPEVTAGYANPLAFGY